MIFTSHMVDVAEIKSQTDQLTFTAGNVHSNVKANTALNDLSDADVLAEVLTGVATLNNISPAEVNAQVDSALNTAIPGTPVADSVNDILNKTKGLVALNTAGYDLSDQLIHANAAEGTMKLFAYTPVRKIICPIGATIRIKFEIKTELAGQMAYGKIYKNGVTFGIERTSIVETYTEFTEDLAFAQDDTIELWCHVANTSWDCYYKNFNIYGNLHKYFVNTL